MTFFRLAMHVHSSWSYDGTWSLAAIATAFRRRRYDAVLLCEHDRSMSADRLDAFRSQCKAESKGIVLVPGVEYSDADNIVHLPTWGPVPFLGADRPTGEVLREVRGHGGVSLLAHPSRNDAWSRIDPSWAPFLAGVEVWSRKYDGWRPNQRALAFAAEHELPLIASLDFHRRRQFAPLALHIAAHATVAAGHPPPQSFLIESLADGQGTAHAAGMPVTSWATGKPAKLLAALNQSRRGAAWAIRKVNP